MRKIVVFLCTYIKVQNIWFHKIFQIFFVKYDLQAGIVLSGVNDKICAVNPCRITNQPLL